MKNIITSFEADFGLESDCVRRYVHVRNVCVGELLYMCLMTSRGAIAMMTNIIFFVVSSQSNSIKNISFELF